MLSPQASIQQWIKQDHFEVVCASLLTRQKFGESSSISTLLLPPGNTRSMLLRNVDARLGVAPLAVQLLCKSVIRPKIREPNMVPSGSKILPTWHEWKKNKHKHFICLCVSLQNTRKSTQTQVKAAASASTSSSYLQGIIHGSIGVDGELIVLGDDGQKLPKARAQATPKLRVYHFKLDQFLSFLRCELCHFPAWNKRWIWQRWVYCDLMGSCMHVSEIRARGFKGMVSYTLKFHENKRLTLRYRSRGAWCYPHPESRMASSLSFSFPVCLEGKGMGGQD